MKNKLKTANQTKQKSLNYVMQKIKEKKLSFSNKQNSADVWLQQIRSGRSQRSRLVIYNRSENNSGKSALTVCKSVNQDIQCSDMIIMNYVNVCRNNHHTSSTAETKTIDWQTN